MMHQKDAAAYALEPRQKAGAEDAAVRRCRLHGGGAGRPAR